MLKLFGHYYYITNLFEFVKRRYFEHFGRASESAGYVSWSFSIRKVIVHILK